MLVEGLYAAQNIQGIWDPPLIDFESRASRDHGGLTALVTYALLAAGESYQDPRLKGAVEFLERVNITGTYARSLRAHVWASLPDSYGVLLRRDHQWLVRAQHKQRGHFNYIIEADNGYDNSTTQYGALGVWESAKRGNFVASAFWAKLENHFHDSQQPSGGWLYRPRGRDGATGSMTAAGLAVLHLTQGYLHKGDYLVPGRTPHLADQKRIQRGVAWLDKYFQPDDNPGSPGRHIHYYLYGIERVGLASGIKYFNDLDWYAAGARWLIDNPFVDERQYEQDVYTSLLAFSPEEKILALERFEAERAARAEGYIADTAQLVNGAFALLFLSRGRMPVAINKLAVNKMHWNNRPRDVANLTDAITHTTENTHLWQLADIDRPAEDWLDAPLLYLASHQALTLSTEQIDKIRRYVQLGGLIVTTADNAHNNFNVSAEELYQQLFPDYALSLLEPDSDLLNNYHLIPENTLGARSVHNGVRHLAVHVPVDMSWTLHAKVQTNTDVWRLMTNVFIYASERGELRPRMARHFENRLETNAPMSRLTVGRAKYSGAWDPEPLAWEAISTALYNDRIAEVTLAQVDLAKLPDPADVPLVHVAGAAPVYFTKQHVESVRAYVIQGGTLLFENVGGRGRFDRGAVSLLEEAFPLKRVGPVALSSSFVSGDGIGGVDLTQLGYRDFTVRRIGPVSLPRLKAIHFDGKPRVFVSAEDLSFGALGQPKDGIFGYDTHSAQLIFTNLVQHVLAR